MESLQYTDRLEESYLSGNRLLKFLSSSLPTHRRFYSKDPLLTKLRIKSRNDLAQLGILVEEVALKLDKNIYEDYLWGKVPDCEVEPSLHPLIFDEDTCPKRSSKKVTFSLHKSNGNEDALYPPDANISSSCSTSTTDFSEGSLSSPEFVHNRGAIVSSSDQMWFGNIAELYTPEHEKRKGSIHHEWGLFPANAVDSFTLDTNDLSSHIFWSRSSHVTESEPKRKSIDNKSFRERNNRHTVQGETNLSVDLKSKNHEGKRSGLKQSSWDSLEDEELDHADYVTQLTQMEFNHRESPVRRLRLNNEFVRRDVEHCNFTANRHKEDERIIAQDIRKPGFPSHQIEDDSNASPTTIIDFNDSSRAPIVGIEQKQVYTDQSSASSSNDEEEDDVDLFECTTIGIVPCDDNSEDLAAHQEHLQYLRNRLIKDDPEADESSWGKNWMKQLNYSTNYTSYNRPEEPDHTLEKTPDAVVSSKSNELSLSSKSKRNHFVNEGRENKGRSRVFNDWNGKCSLDAPDDEYDFHPRTSSPDYNNADVM